ncbi:hypothetical protein N658DRAFT_534969 [Parathielavia hyrcaniae]|uniref:Insecticidal crystal toxin domain-containing protein n=1 Tax=Parathielavia hyrcaniae TaxID=113614 RepID=A0AAN6Q4Q0_9PEZI|nr:hypothetical protein N658DRAFT_534969 [Parathielavia hyrcaniae]
MDGSVWRPRAPEGYVTLGDVANSGHGKPSLDKVWCLRSDLVADGAVQVADAKNQRAPVWDDRDSGGKHDASFWDVFPRRGNSSSEHIPVLAGTFLTASGYGVPAEAPKGPALYVPKAARPFSPRPPEIPAGGVVPEVRELFDEMEQNAITLPFTSFFEPNDQASLRNMADPFCTLRKRVSWEVLEKYPNYQSTALTQTSTVTVGIRRTDTTSSSHSVAITMESEANYGLAKWSISLNSQFTFAQSSSVEELQERTMIKTITVAPRTVAVAWAKRVVIQATRSDGSKINNDVSLLANDEIAVTEIPVKA